MPDIPTPDRTNAVLDFLDRVFPNKGKTILDRAYLDIRRPTLHDTKGEFRAEFEAVERSTNDLLSLYGFMLKQGDASIESSRGIPVAFMFGALERNKKDGRPNDALDLVMQNARSVDYWRFSRNYVFDLYLSFSARLAELKEQGDAYWSAPGRPPDHFARVMALRLAKLYAKQFNRMPTIGTASDGDHPSTEYGRFLQELFEALEIGTGFRLPGEWAILSFQKMMFRKPLLQNLRTMGCFLTCSLGKISRQTRGVSAFPDGFCKPFGMRHTKSRNTVWSSKMANLFEQNRNYVLGDDELNIIGDRDKLAQWRHKGMGPAFYKLGRKIIYRGADLNKWAEAQRVDPSKGGQV